jgi:hypothetical protein
MSDKYTTQDVLDRLINGQVKQAKRQAAEGGITLAEFVKLTRDLDNMTERWHIVKLFGDCVPNQKAE